MRRDPTAFAAKNTLRLRHIKIAGFKSFADPVQLAVPGQLLGVVGPNGCGKSNVVDALRWVLGESQARHLRGETMQDVIFNGTTQRPFANRASVELVFDNSLGRVGGQWGQYGDIAVKRVLERDGESGYYINNQHVRRRDITDIFLGTGLGPRAYAIIEQGMISRIVESKPEELRVFLEEAAGVSKYKERRRETELRLNDTRQNLARTHDILQELSGQLEKLDAQRQTAQRYNELQGQLQTTQNLLWFLRKRDAGNARERHGRELARLQNELEQQIAQLREAEKRLEQTRQDHFHAGDAMHGAQGKLYEINAEVARVEQQLQFIRDNKRRVEQQRNAAAEQESTARAEAQQTQEKLTALRAEHAAAIELRTQREQELVGLREALPAAESAFAQAAQRQRETRETLAQLQQSLSVAQANRGHAQRAIEQLAGRAAKLEEEQLDLIAPDGARLERDALALEGMDRDLGALGEQTGALQAQAAALRDRQAAAAQAVEETNARATKLEGQIQALERLQAKLMDDASVNAFLAEHGMQDAPRLWQSIDVAAGWEDAFEAVFGLRLNAVGLQQLDVSAGMPTPPAGVAFFAGGAADESHAPTFDGVALMQHVRVNDARAHGILADWLKNVYAVEDWRASLSHCATLPPGALMVSRDGHVLTRHSVSFFAPNAQMHGVLARRREIDELRAQLSTLQQELGERREQLTQVRTEQQQHETHANALRQQQAELQTKRHAAQLEIVRMSELSERINARAAQVASELAELARQSGMEQQAQQHLASEIDAALQEQARIGAQMSEAESLHARAQQTLAERRGAVQSAERAQQEAAFAEKSGAERIANNEQELQRTQRRLDELAQQQQSLQAEASELDDAALVAALNQVLSVREGAEQTLAQARVTVESIASQIAQTDGERQASEARVEPLRESMNEVRLKEQEARLAETQYAEQLAAHGATDEVLLPLIEKGARSSHLQTELNRLTAEIEALGPVNLAAVAEFDSAFERKGYLDAQVGDLTEAVATLENAIRRIDRETRELLRDTFDKVNNSFGTLFPQLFGGGRASIALTGDEILDAGLEVTAQPPGKKTSSIHLLSGGEKALTALSLVFAIFQLNPAPFCVLDEVDAPLDDANTVRFCDLVKRMAANTQFLFISHNKLTMEMAEQLVGITMQESGVSRVVAVDMEQALRMRDEVAAA